MTDIALTGKAFIPAGTLNIRFKDGEVLTIEIPANPTHEDIVKAIKAKLA